MVELLLQLGLSENDSCMGQPNCFDADKNEREFIVRLFECTEWTPPSFHAASGTSLERTLWQGRIRSTCHSLPPTSFRRLPHLPILVKEDLVYANFFEVVRQWDRVGLLVVAGMRNKNADRKSSDELSFQSGPQERYTLVIEPSYHSDHGQYPLLWARSFPKFLLLRAEPATSQDPFRHLAFFPSRGARNTYYV
jgi:hypothetical protein